MVTTSSTLRDERPLAGDHPAATPESSWRSWDGWDRLSDLELPRAGDRVVVVSAHPDDEVLALGGLLQRLGKHGCELVLVCVTDGEASHPGSPTTTPEELAARRPEELARAVARLGHAGAEQLHLHLPDSRVGEHPTELVHRLEPHLAGAALAVAPWSGDGHPDHEACGRAVGAAARDLRLVARCVRGVASTRPLLPVWEYPVWAWHWARPGSTALPWSRARVLRLTVDERLAKAEAMACFETQVRPRSDDPADAPPVPADVLAHFTRAHEVVFA